ncbi:hypothetical protein BACEGG_01678 [Bacteroides eggerthii DSM 20697]|nr:hypothetical protein BACEGG_01678 [Bacteroides eggerthii DSM 20697]
MIHCWLKLYKGHHFSWNKQYLFDRKMKKKCVYLHFGNERIPYK